MEKIQIKNYLQKASQIKICGIFWFMRVYRFDSKFTGNMRMQSVYEYRLSRVIAQNHMMQYFLF